MKKIALTSLAVMAVVGVFAIQPVDAKKGRTRSSNDTY